MSQSWVSAEQTFLTLCKLLVILKPGRTRFIRHGRTSFHSVGISLFKKSIALKEINVLLEKIFFLCRLSYSNHLWQEFGCRY